jgi:hypothetical protein
VVTRKRAQAVSSREHGSCAGMALVQANENADEEKRHRAKSRGERPFGASDGGRSHRIHLRDCAPKDNTSLSVQGSR